MSSGIYLPSEIAVSKLEFSPVKVLDSGGKSVNLRYEGRNIMVEAPSLSVPYGVNVFDKTPGAPVKYSVDLSLRGADDNDAVRALQEFLEAFDERMIDAGVENASKWFKMANPSREVIRAFYTPVVKVSRDKDGNPKPYPPTFKLALRKRLVKGAAPDSTSLARTFETRFYDGTAGGGKAVAEFDGETKLEELLPKRSQATVIMQCTGMWFAGGKFGTTWKAVQLRVDSQPEQIRGPAFRSEAPDVRAFVARSATAAAGAGGDYDGYGGGDDGEEEDDVVAAVAPVPARKAAAPAPAPAPAPPAFEDDDDHVAEPVAVPVKAKVTATKKVVKKSAVA